MGRFVIAAYKPKEGKEEQLRELVKKHLDVLRGEDLVTDKDAYVMRSADGTFLEVFEWRSAKAVEKAHSNPRVQALWGEFAELSDYRPLSELDETRQMVC